MFFKKTSCLRLVFDKPRLSNARGTNRETMMNAFLQVAVFSTAYARAGAAKPLEFQGFRDAGGTQLARSAESGVGRQSGKTKATGGEPMAF
jgi:hypothetical protein